MQAEDEHAHEEDEEHEGEEGHEYDEHIWLSLRNAYALADVIADALAKADEAGAEIAERAETEGIEERGTSLMALIAAKGLAVGYESSADGKPVTVLGTFDLYSENGNQYCVFKDAVLE